MQSVRLNLQTGDYEPNFADVPNALQLSTQALLEKFADLLIAESIEVESLKEAMAEFKFDNENWAESCRIYVLTSAEKFLEVTVTSSGNVEKGP